MRTAFFVCLIALCGNAFGQSGSDIWLMENIQWQNNGFRLGNEENITAQEGYDNQPAFSADGKFLYFSAIRDGKQADIYRYSLATGNISQITDTPESEYSPTPLPDGTHLSVVKVEKNKTQRIWQVPISAKKPRQTLISESCDSVGYHCWLDDHTLAVYILGKPSSLRMLDLETNKETVLASKVGRCIQKVPGKNAISYTVESGNAMQLMMWNRTTKKHVPVCQLPENAQDYLWLQDGRLLCGNQGSIWRYDFDAGRWMPATSFPDEKMVGLSRMAESPDGRHFAIVIAEVK